MGFADQMSLGDTKKRAFNNSCDMFRLNWEIFKETQFVENRLFKGTFRTKIEMGSFASVKFGSGFH